MKAKEFILENKKVDAAKPRNFVAKNAMKTTSGAGAHKDKKRAEKQGDVKHKQKQFEQGVEEGWKDKLAAAALAGTIGLSAAGNASARVLPGADPSINRFTGEPIATQQVKPGDMKKDNSEQKIGFSTEYLKKVVDGKHPRPMISVDDAKKELERRSQGVAEVSRATLDRYVSKASDAHGDADFSARMSKHDPDKRSYHVDQKKTAEKRRRGISRALDRMSKEGVAEGEGGFDIEDMVMDQYRNGNDVWEIAQYLGIGEDEVQDIIDSNEKGVAEATPETTVSALRGYKTWQVWIKNNYYNGKYPDYSARPYRVIARSENEARQVVLDNADRVLKDLLSKKFPSGKRVLPPKSALPVEAKHIGAVDDGTMKGQITTSRPITMLSPQGPMTVMLDGGNIVDVERDVEEAKRPDRAMPATDLQVGDRVVADTSKENYPGGHKQRVGIVTRVGQKGVHIKTDDSDEPEWHPYKIVKKVGVDEARQSVAVKLGKAWDQQKAKSAASRERAKELLNPAKKDEKKDVKEAYAGDVTFKVGGWTYYAEENQEDDVTKMFHDAVSPSGKRYSIDFSPYETMTPETFKLWVMMKMPKRQGRGPLDNKQILQLAKARS